MLTTIFHPRSTRSPETHVSLHQGRVEEAKATLHTLRGDSYAEEKIMEVLWACLKKRIHLDLEEVIGLYDNSNGSLLFIKRNRNNSWVYNTV